MATAQRRTTIEPIIDARSQFVAFASSGLERCGVYSPAKSLSHNRALQLGTTITVATKAHDDSDGPAKVHVCAFIGLSATLGAVWCRALDHDDDCLVFGSVEARVGDGKFVCPSWGDTHVVDNNGNVVATIDGSSGLFWRSNSKWLVKFEQTSKNLVVWRLARDGAPASSNGVRVERTVPLGGRGARFSPFDDPRGDQLVFVGSTIPCSDEPRVPLLSFVDLEKSVAAGVTVKARESVLLQEPNPLELVWCSPDTILTLHWDASDDGHRVYNAATGQLMCTFPSTYDLVTVSSEHIVWFRRDLAMCEVYHASSSSDMMMKPCCSYQGNPLLNCDGCGSSSKEIYVVRRPDDAVAVTTCCVHYTITGTQLATLTINN
ncbi:hypothetical protein Pelo_2379 [Pelomyxa schiedti]|nr:hypothetical protein Pelo_2379 [Pelomyxa schiedti]